MPLTEFTFSIQYKSLHFIFSKSRTLATEADLGKHHQWIGKIIQLVQTNIISISQPSTALMV